jgi:hypothetical protein
MEHGVELRKDQKSSRHKPTQEQIAELKREFQNGKSQRWLSVEGLSRLSHKPPRLEEQRRSELMMKQREARVARDAELRQTNSLNCEIINPPTNR